jgi:hypothetical protein
MVRAGARRDRPGRVRSRLAKAHQVLNRWPSPFATNEIKAFNLGVATSEARTDFPRPRPGDRSAYYSDVAEYEHVASAEYRRIR